MRGMGRGGQWLGGPLKERPSEIVKRHIAVTPFGEDNVSEVAAEVGVDSLVLGSDFPCAGGFGGAGVNCADHDDPDQCRHSKGNA